MVLQAAGLQEYIPDIGYVSVFLKKLATRYSFTCTLSPACYYTHLALGGNNLPKSKHLPLFHR
jgi:hypothetical protein